EIKRLYVRASHRRHGLAQKLLRTLEQHASQVPYEWLYLDTKDDLNNATRFYERHGYQHCDRYNSNPQATIFMRKPLLGLSLPPTLGTPNFDRARSGVLIRSFQAEDANDFRRLNEEWITRYF